MTMETLSRDSSKFLFISINICCNSFCTFGFWLLVYLLLLFRFHLLANVFSFKCLFFSKPQQLEPRKLTCSSVSPCQNIAPQCSAHSCCFSLQLSLATIEQKIFNLKQFGFKKNFSTAHAIINLTDSIENEFDKNNFACGIFNDLHKAFDTVDREILLKKLWHYGVRGIDNNPLTTTFALHKIFFFKTPDCLITNESLLRQVIVDNPSTTNFPDHIETTDWFLYDQDTGL